MAPWAAGSIPIRERPAAGGAPTLVAEYETVWSNTTTPKTQSVTVANGDVLVIVAGGADQSCQLATPTGGGLTYTLRQSTLASGYASTYIWTASASSAQTFTLSQSVSAGSDLWGFNCLRFSGSSGIGNSAKANLSSGTPTVSLTTTLANSAIVCINLDWNAIDGASRTWNTINSITPTSGNGLEKSYYRNSASWTVYTALWDNVGAIGAKSVGLGAPASQAWSCMAVEVKGT